MVFYGQFPNKAYNSVRWACLYSLARKRKKEEVPFRGRIMKSIYNLVSHCLPWNSSHNVVNHAIGIIEAFSNVNIVAKLLAKLQEVESSCRCTYNCVCGVIM